MNQRMKNMGRDMVTYGKLIATQFLYDKNLKENNTFAFQFVKKWCPQLYYFLIVYMYIRPIMHLMTILKSVRLNMFHRKN